jgi:signal transduction histidine kinase/DNA-binding response OmpR family regulator
MNPRNTQSPQDLSFLAGGGEMGAHTRAKDWSKSPVGPVEIWPQSLRTAVSICLGSRHPIVLWWGKEQLTQFYNDAYISFLGQSKHPGALGQPAYECWSEIWSTIEPMVEGVYRSGEATWSEDLLLFINRRLPQEEGYFTFSYSPIRDDDGAIGGIFCACIETTDRVIGERRLRTLRDLGREEAEARTAAEACERAVRTLGKNPADIPFAIIYLFDNASGCARLVAASGFTPGSKSAPREIDLGEGATGTPVWPLARVLQTGRHEDIPDVATIFGSLPDGSWPEAPTSARIVPIPAPGTNVPIAFLVSGISPRRLFDADYKGFFDLVAGHVGASIANARAYEEERRRAEALAEIDRVKTAFFSNVSHEFRTPLTLMLGPLEEALAKPAKSPEQKRLIDTAHRNALRLLKLVNSLLDFSRMEAGRAEAIYEPVDLAALTVEIASNFESVCERAGLRLTVDCATLPMPVFVDRDMWEKIVLNLLSNAFKFTFKGGITVRLVETDGQANLQVQDTGVGVPDYELPRLFERFHRIEGQRSRTHEGSGIGLALVQELVRLHGGTICAHSEPARGTGFEIRLPFGSAHLPQDRIRAERRLAPTTVDPQAYVQDALGSFPDEMPPPSAEKMEKFPGDFPVLDGGGSVLVADDNSDMRAYVGRLLGRYFEVRTVAAGDAALAVLRERRADLVIADVMMPGLDGFALVRAIRADPALAKVPVILLSARAGEEASIEGLEAGADDYLVKPFSARELIARVTATLKMARVREEADRHLAADLQAMTRLCEIGRLCMHTGDQSPTCMEEILHAAIAVSGAAKGNVQLLDVPSGTLRIAVQQGFEEPFLSFFAGVDDSDPAACGAALRRTERVIVEDVTQSDIFAGQPALSVLLEADVRAVQSTPLISSGGTLLGTISTHFSSPHRPGERELRLLDLLARQAADYLERRQSEIALRVLNETLQDKVAERTHALAAEMAERQKAEAALQQALRLEAIGRLTGGVAHDFNNILTVVLGHATAIMTAAGNPRLARLAAAIEHAADRGARLTRQLLAFARRQQLQPTVVVFDRLIEGVDDLIRRAAGELIAVEFAAPGDLWPILVDSAQLESALLNLTMNARDAMIEGGSLTVSARNAVIADGEADRLGIVASDYVVVSVADTGTGMSPEVSAHAFEPFFTTKDVDKGTGLGLAQTYGFAKQSGGTAAIESAPGAGTTVSLYLPRGQIRSVAEATLPEGAGTPNGHGKTVLIVEDQYDVREMIEMYLDGLGYRTLTARDGLEAQRILASGQPIDLLLSDMVMPNGVGGLDLARSARQCRGDLKIVLASGYPHEISIGEDGWSDEFIFLQKPFRPEELARTIARAIEDDSRGNRSLKDLRRSE